MQNKPNFKDVQINVSNIITRNYKNIISLAGQKNKPNPSGLRCLPRSCRTDQTQFRTEHEFVNWMKPKLLNFHIKIRKKTENTQFSTLSHPALKPETIYLRNKKVIISRILPPAANTKKRL